MTVKKIIENYENMVFEKPFDSAMAEESIAFKIRSVRLDFLLHFNSNKSPN